MSETVTVTVTQPIASVGEFLAHALELETEAAERYRVLADSMEVHNNRQVAELFQSMAMFSDQHAAEVRERARGIEIPVIAPWDFKWSCPESPEAPCMEDVNYLMTPRQVLDLALHNETRGRDFYAGVAAQSPDEAVRRIAQEMADEESEHVRLLEQWLTRVGGDEAPLEDLDPPNMPE